MKTAELVRWLDAYLQSADFQDYAPNGLQVQGREEIGRIAFGVSASLEFLEKAAAWGAEGVLVHHGWFWRGEPAAVVGMKHARLAFLLKRDMPLIAYHLPLDAHPESGNNAELGRLLGLRIEERLGEHGFLHVGAPLEGEISAGAFAERVERVLGRRPLLVGDPAKALRRIGWCSGAAQGMIGEAAAAGCDLYLSGEIRESTPYEARELDCAYLAAGHYATEQFGVQALMRRIEAAFPGTQTAFISVDNPA